MSAFLDKLLKHFDISIEDYHNLIAEPSFSSIPLLNNEDENVVKAKQIVLKAVREHQKVIVYGDYDCDGIMSTSIIVKTFKKLGLEISSYIPSRYVDGYGINVENAKKIAAAKYDLVILVDNGISAFEGIDELKKNNIAVLVLDHHEIGEKLPNADCILHAEILKYGDYPISAGFLSFLFSYELLNHKDEYLFCLGALSIFSDMMPLRGHNRTSVRLLLKSLNEFQFPQFTILNDGYTFDYEGLSLGVIPSINAIGRMVEDTTINRLISYFVDEDMNKINAIANWMKSINIERKVLNKDAKSAISVNNDDYGIILVSNLKEGLNGILANQVLKQYNKPTIVFSESKKDSSVLIGSIRSLKGLSCIDCFEYLNSFLLTSGGHEFAGGLSIKKENLDNFKKSFNKYCFDNPVIVKNDYILFSPEEINEENCSIFKSFEPFGVSWEQPKLLIKDISTENFTFVKEGKILSTKITENSKILSFTISNDSLKNKFKINLCGKLRDNIWKDKKTTEFLCEEEK